MSIVNVLTLLTLEVGDVERDMVVLESWIPSVLIIGVDWLITAKRLLNIDAECPNDIVDFLLSCERLKDKVLGKIIEVCGLLTGVEVVGSIDIPTDEFCNTRDSETILVFSDNEVDGTESIVEVTFDNINERVGINDAKVELLDIDEADSTDEVTFGPMLWKAVLSWPVIPVLFSTIATEPETVDNILLECNVCGVWEKEAEEDVESDSKNELR